MISIRELRPGDDLAAVLTLCKGIGTRVLGEARTYFQRKGIRYFTLYTAVSNRDALTFYERNSMAPLHTTLIGKTKDTGNGG
jgi:hypothetical protein